jgi:hypothetical protein
MPRGQKVEGIMGTYPEVLDEIQTKSYEFSSLLFTVTSSALPWDYYFFKLTQPLTASTVQLMYTVKLKGEKRDKISYPLSFGLRTHTENSSLRTEMRLCPETSTQFYVHEFGFWTRVTDILVFQKVCTSIRELKPRQRLKPQHYHDLPCACISWWKLEEGEGHYRMGCCDS